MKKNVIIIILFFNFKSFCQNDLLPKKMYSENLFGNTILDEYHYQTSDIDSLLVQNWFKKIHTKTNTILKSINGRDLITNSLKVEKDNYSNDIEALKVSHNQTLYYLNKDDELCYRLKNSNIENTIFDTKKDLVRNNDTLYISYLKPSWDEKLLAIEVLKKGTEIGSIIFVDIEKKEILPYEIKNTKISNIGGVIWTPDNKSIIFIVFPVIDIKNSEYILNGELVKYTIGDIPSNFNVLISKNNNPELKINPEDFPLLNSFDPNERYALFTLSGVTSNKDTYLLDMQELNSSGGINLIPLYTKDDKFFNPVIFKNEVFFLSSKENSNFEILKYNIYTKQITQFVKPFKKEVITSFTVNIDGVYVTTTKNGVEASLYFYKDGKQTRINLPYKSGYIYDRNYSSNSSDIWFILSSWLKPFNRYKYSLKDNTFTLDNYSETQDYPEFSNFNVDEIEVSSYDNELIPVSIIYNKKLKRNKKNNVLFHFYGAYGVSISPYFDSQMLRWVEQGGVLVMPHIRGGKEKGELWYKNGFKSTKENSWKDIISVAEYLIKNKITNPEKIALYSYSAGGIPLGRAIIDRPDLFKAAVCQNCMFSTVDIDKTHNGPNNMKEFGDPKIEEEFKALLKMDSYQNIKPNQKYPSLLLLVGMKDERVSPIISAKFYNKIIENSISNSNVYLMSVYFDGGHTNTTEDTYEEVTDMLSFLFWQLNHKKFNIKPIKNPNP